MSAFAAELLAFVNDEVCLSDSPIATDTELLLSGLIDSLGVIQIVEWIERSNGRVRADVVHDKLVAMGYQGSERTTRRVVAALKAAHERDNHRVYKPWITEPGAWLQYDFGAGPVIDGLSVILFCASSRAFSGAEPSRAPRHSLRVVSALSTMTSSPVAPRA